MTLPVHPSTWDTPVGPVVSGSPRPSDPFVSDLTRTAQECTDRIGQLDDPSCALSAEDKASRRSALQNVLESVAALLSVLPESPSSCPSAPSAPQGSSASAETQQAALPMIPEEDAPSIDPPTPPYPPRTHGRRLAVSPPRPVGQGSPVRSGEGGQSGNGFDRVSRLSGVSGAVGVRGVARSSDPSFGASRGYRRGGVAPLVLASSSISSSSSTSSQSLGVVPSSLVSHTSYYPSPRVSFYPGRRLASGSGQSRQSRQSVLRLGQPGQLFMGTGRTVYPSSRPVGVVPQLDYATGQSGESIWGTARTFYPSWWSGGEVLPSVVAAGQSFGPSPAESVRHRVVSGSSGHNGAVGSVRQSFYSFGRRDRDGVSFYPSRLGHRVPYGENRPFASGVSLRLSSSGCLL